MLANALYLLEVSVYGISLISNLILCTMRQTNIVDIRRSTRVLGTYVGLIGAGDESSRPANFECLMLLEHANIFTCLPKPQTLQAFPPHIQYTVHTPVMSAKIQKVIARQKSK